MNFGKLRGWQASMSGHGQGELRRLKDMTRGSEVAIMAWARALIPFFGVDVPASNRVRERRAYSQKTKKAKKADAIPWLTVHASSLKLLEVTMCEVGCCRARFLQGGWGLHKNG